MNLRTADDFEDGNTLSKPNYVFKHIIVASLAFVWYRDILFRNITGLTHSQSLTVLVILLAGSIAFRIVLTLRQGRSDANMAYNIIIPFMVYTVLSCQADISTHWCVLIVILLVMYEYETLMLLSENLRYWRRRAASREKVLLSPKVRTGIMIACCTLCLALFVGADVVLGKVTFFPPASAGSQSDESGPSIESNLDALAPILNAGVWYDLSTEQKLLTMQTVADIEAYRLGVSEELDIVLGDLEDSTLGTFNASTYLITIDRAHFEEDLPAEVLETVCHEAFHAYQQSLCKAYSSMDEAYKDL